MGHFIQVGAQVFIRVVINNGGRVFCGVCGCCGHSENCRSRLSCGGVPVLWGNNVVKCHYHKTIALVILHLCLLYWLSELLELLGLVASVNLQPGHCYDGLLPAFAAS